MDACTFLFIRTNQLSQVSPPSPACHPPAPPPSPIFVLCPIQCIECFMSRWFPSHWLDLDSFFPIDSVGRPSLPKDSPPKNPIQANPCVGIAAIPVTQLWAIGGLLKRLLIRNGHQTVTVKSLTESPATFCRRLDTRTAVEWQEISQSICILNRHPHRAPDESNRDVHR